MFAIIAEVCDRVLFLKRIRKNKMNENDESSCEPEEEEQCSKCQSFYEMAIDVIHCCYITFHCEEKIRHIGL